MLKKKLIGLLITVSFLGSLFVGISLFSEPATANQGGPDEFGYIWVDSNAPSPTVTYGWIDASAGTELLWIDGRNPPGDDMYNHTELPFPFEFYGVEYTAIYVNLNGVIDFGDPNIEHDEYSNTNISDPASPNNYIAAFWDDLQIFDSISQKVTVMEGGTAPDRYFVIEWYHVSFFAADTTEITFEMILYEKDSVIKLQYQQVESGSDTGNNGAEATVGIENQDGSVGLLYSYNKPAIQNGMAIEIRLPDYEFDIEVDDFSAPEYSKTGSPFYVNATVTNKGDYYETDIELVFTVNEVVEGQDSLDLNPDESQNVSFQYTAPSDGEYTLKIEAIPIPDEEFIVNNVQWSVMNAFTPTHYLLVDIGHDNDLSNLDSFFEELFLHKYWVNYTDQPLLTGALYGYDALLCLRPSISYAPNEAGAIQDEVKGEGLDLFVLAGDNQIALSSLTVTNPYPPFDPWSNISWDGPAPSSADMVTNNIAFHPIGDDIEELYYTSQTFSIGNDTGAIHIVKDYLGETILGAADRVSLGKIYAVNGPGDFDNSRIDNYDTKRYLENIFEWLLRPVKENDVGIWNFEAPDVSLPSVNFFINATISNYGSSDQSSVDVILNIDGGFADFYTISPLPSGASENISFTYSHGTEKTILVELEAIPASPDEYPEDNIVNKSVLITSLMVVGWTYSSLSSDFTEGLEDIMERILINYDPVPSGYGETGPSPSLWDYPLIILDANDDVKDKDAILDTAFNGSIVVVNYDTFEQLLDELNSPSVFENTTFGFTSRYIFVGGGLIVESDFSNDNKLAGEWRYYSNTKKDDLASHLSELMNILLRDNDITVSMMTAQPYAITGLTIYVNATVYNAGTSSASSILVNFSVDSVVTDSYTIPLLTDDSWEVVSFTWTPSSDGTYELEISAALKPGEVYDTNNYQSVTTRAYSPTNYILVDSGHSTQKAEYEMLLEDQRDRNFWINYSKTLDSNTLSKHDLFVSLNPGSTYTIGELNALKTFLTNEGGMFVIGGSNQTVLYELTSYANLSWDGIALTGSEYSQNLMTHDTTTDIDRIYYTPAPFSVKTNGIAGPVAYDSTNSIIISAYSVYGQGKVIALSGELDFTDDYLMFDENLNFSRNIIDWLFVPLESHDLSITNFELAPLLKLNEEVYLNATLGNIGQNTENGVVVDLIINGSVEDSRMISSITPGDSTLISFPWTPLYEDNYTIRIEAQAVLGEIKLENNYVEKNTSAKDFLGIVLFDQTHGADNIATYSEWTDVLTQEGIGIETHDSGPITSEVLYGYGAFVSIQASTTYTTSELQAIEDFVQGGGGLMVIGDDNPNVYTGLTEFAQMNWESSSGGTGITTDITHHQITIGVESFYLGAPVAEIILNGTDSIDIIRSSNDLIMLAVCSNPGRVIAWADEHTVDNSYIDDEDNERCGINAVKWLLGVSTPHDLAISSLEAPSVMQPGDTIYINTTVWNFGTYDEQDVYVNLSVEGQLNDTYFIPFLQNGTSSEVSFTFTAYEERIYNISVTISAHPDEKFLENNIANKTIRSRFIEGGILWEQGHDCGAISWYSYLINDLEELGFAIETNNEPITDDILDRDNYAVYVIPNPDSGATSDPPEFTSTEIMAIQNFVANGGGLFVIGDERQEDILASLTGFAGINWTDSSGSGVCDEIVPHEVTQGVNTVDIYNTIARIFIDNNDAMAVVNHTTGGNTMCAVSEPTGYPGRVAGFADEDSIEDGGVNEGDNLQLAVNIILWLAAPATVNHPPSAIGMDFESNEMYRGDSIEISGHGNDTEDPESSLTPHFEYRDPNEVSWNTTYLSSPYMDGGTWKVIFSPPIDPIAAPIGYYDFRVMFNDTKGAFSNYYYANDSVEVKNNEPIAENVTLDTTSVFRTQSVYVYANASDAENSEDVLIPEFEHRNETGSWNSSYFAEDLTYITSGMDGFWRLTFSPPKEALLGDYDFRVRFGDQDGNYSGWIQQEDVLIVKNNRPHALELSSSWSSVYRGDTIVIYANGFDVEDDEDQLSAYIQYQPPDGGWFTSYLSDLVYDTDANAWVMNFTPELNAELGSYDLSVMFIDLDSDQSVYNYSYDLVEVLNSYPVADNITIPSSVTRGGSVNIYANGTDKEDSESILIPHFSSKAPDSDEWENTLFSEPIYINGRWVVIFDIPISLEMGEYDIRVIFEDDDGNLSSPVLGSIDVINNLPTTIELRPLESSLYRTETVIIRAKGRDREDESSDLDATFQYKFFSDTFWQTFYLSNQKYDANTEYHTIEFTPPGNAETGMYDLRVRFKDSDDSFSKWVYKNGSVEVLSHPPVALDITLEVNEILRGEEVYIFANGEDYEDQVGDLNPHFEYQNPITGSWEDAYLGSQTQIDDRFRVTFAPIASAPTGPYSFRVRFSDSDGDFSDWIYSDDSINVENNPPTVDILTDGLQDSATVTFSASVSDYEDENSDLEFRWDFGDGFTSTEESPEHIYEESGTYTVKLRVTDKDESVVTDEATITINVKAEDGGDGGFDMMLLLLIFLPIIIVIIILILLLTRKKKEEVAPPTAPVVATVAQPPAQPTTPAVAAEVVTEAPTAPTPMVTISKPAAPSATVTKGLRKIRCPKCAQIFQVEAKAGATVMVQCPSCGIKGQMKF